MRNLFVVTALLCLISVSVVSEFHTEEVWPGGEVTLRCSNFSKVADHISWFKLDNRANISRICSMIKSGENASFYDGYNKGRFDLTSNTTTLFLNIKQVDLSDSGLYFCGDHCQEKPLIVSATYLKVQGESGEEISTECKQECDGTWKLTSVILGAVTVVLVLVIIGLVVAYMKLRTAIKEGGNPEQSENMASDELNYAAVTFKPKAKRRVMEPSVVYAATR